MDSQGAYEPFSRNRPSHDAGCSVLIYQRALEVDVSGELEVARSGRAGDAADLAEVRVAKRRCGIRECDLVPDVDAVDLKDEGSDVLGQIEALAQGGIEVLVAGTSQGERSGTRRVADQIDRAAGREMLLAFLNCVEST